MATRKVGALGLDLIANTGQFLKDMTRAGQAVEGLSKTVKGAMGLIKAAVVAVGAGFTIAKIVEGLEGAAAAMEKVGMAAKRVHASSEEISGLRVAAGQAGVGFDQLLGIVQKFQINLGKSTEGSTRASAAMARLGIQAYDTAGKTRPITALIAEIGTAIQQLDDAGEQASIAEAIFGKGGAGPFLDLVNDAGDFFANLGFNIEKARRAGVLWTDEQTALAKKMGDAWTDVKTSMEGLYSKVVVVIAPYLTSFFERLATWIAALPIMLQALSNSISRAFGGQGGAAGNAEREKWTAFWSSLGNLAVAGLAAVGGSIAVVASELTDKTLDRIYEAIKRWFKQLGPKLGIDIALAVNEAMMSVANWISQNDFMQAGASAGAFGGLLKWAGGADQIKFLKENIDQLEADRARLQLGIPLGAGIDTAPGVAKAQETLMQSLADPQTRAWLSGVGQKLKEAIAGIDFEGATVEFSDAADAIIHFRDALAAANIEIPELAAGLEAKVRPALTAAREAWNDFTTGIRGAIGELRKTANDWSGLGSDVLVQGVNSWSQGWAQAFRDIESGAMKWQGAMKSVMLNVAGSIQDVLVRFAALRIAMGLLGGLGIGIPSAAASTGGSYPYQSAGGTMAPVLASDVPSFADGGFVSKPTLAVVGDAPGGEHIIPAGKLGGTTVQVIDQRGAGAPPIESQSTTGPNGERIVRLLVREEVMRMHGDRSLDRSMSDAYGLNRRPQL